MTGQHKPSPTNMTPTPVEVLGTVGAQRATPNISLTVFFKNRIS